ncbi:MAG TPA: glycosyltransferase [Thermoanaerobaculia bacterium]|nr:glycosyltransferase [Thermoanaerobaculia bacterium]
MSEGAVAEQLTVVVPTRGESPHLGSCLMSLRGDGCRDVVLVVQGAGEEADALRRRFEDFVDRWIVRDDNLGFAAGTNLGIATSERPYVATVNDDAVVRRGWCETLLGALDADPGVAAVQGVNLRMADPSRVDGAGLAWNRWWQAVQLGRGEAAPDEGAAPHETFGVSATAAVYRRVAINGVALAGVATGGGPFDERLVSWYEDADLAVRLRGAGGRALVVPAARALHAGGATGGRRPRRYQALLYANRWLAVMRLLGYRFPFAKPRLVARDLADLAAGRVGALTLAAAWLRVMRRFPGFAHLGRPLVGREELRRLAAG